MVAAGAGAGAGAGAVAAAGAEAASAALAGALCAQLAPTAASDTTAALNRLMQRMSTPPYLFAVVFRMRVYSFWPYWPRVRNSCVQLLASPAFQPGAVNDATPVPS